MKVLLTGANGQLGRCFQDIFPSDWELIPTDSDVLDITNQHSVNEFVQLYQPNVIVNAAAYTAVDKAESEFDIAERINAQGPYYLALASAEIGAHFFHVSTDYVFDGSNSTPYKEIDQTNPISVYGKTKLKGEKLSLAANRNTVIIRTAWVFSEYGNNFVKTILRLAQEKDRLCIVNDQFGGPTYAKDIANAIIKIIRICFEKNIAMSGIFNYTGEPYVSWFQFAEKIVEIGKEKGLIKPNFILDCIKTSEYPTLAARPISSKLDNRKMKISFDIDSSDWSIALDAVINKL